MRPAIAEGAWTATGKKHRIPEKWRRRRSAGTHGIHFFEPALAVAFLILLAIPISKDIPSIVMVRAERAQELLDELRAALLIADSVHVSVVVSHPLVFAVKPADIRKSHFVLSMEMGFLLTLEEDELRAALAHELGHVWVFTNHPYLQTERLANTIGQRIVPRNSFEKLYAKLWAYEDTPGVPIDQLLAPRADRTLQAESVLNSGS
jgi:hypothetical protein